MPMEPMHFDEEFQNEHDTDATVVDIHGAHHHINKILGDLQFKRMDDFITGISDYEAKVSVLNTHFNSLDDSHPLQDDEVIMLCYGQQHNIDVDIDEDDNAAGEEHADGIAYLTPTQAREVADALEEYADKAEEENEDSDE